MSKKIDIDSWMASVANSDENAFNEDYKDLDTLHILHNDLTGALQEVIAQLSAIQK